METVMSTSKRISWTRTVPLLTTALLVSCCLLSEKTPASGLFKLTRSKAYTATFTDTSTFNILSTQWDYNDSTTLNKNFALVGDGSSSYNVYQLSFSGTYYGNDELLWGVDIYDSSGNTLLYFGSYIDVGQVLVLGLPTVAPTQYSQHTDIVYRCHLYVKKKNGGNIDRVDMRASNFTWYFNRTEDIEQSTNPAEWYGTSTVAFQNPMETATTIVPPNYLIDEDTIEDSLDIPQRILGAMGFVIGIITQLLTLKYVTFMLCFGIVVALLGWFLH